MENVYLGRQPIVDVDENLRAYDILYREAWKNPEMKGGGHASASVINSVLNKFGTRSILGDRRGFVKIDEQFLMNDVMLSVPSDFFVFSILQDVPMSAKVLERIRRLSSAGYVLAIDDMPLTAQSVEKYGAVFKELTFVKTTFNLDLSPGVKDVIAKIKLNDVTIVATAIEDSQTYEFAKELGCDWFVGYFFAAPRILQNATPEPSQIKVLGLYNLLTRDVSIDEITKEFENSPEITVQLLQLINSGYFNFRNPISSIRHVLALVGRVAIGQWLMLMIYSRSATKSNQRAPLALMIKSRTDLMENILKLIDPNIGNNMLGEAYLVGVLSLIDTLFERKLSDILEIINISKEVSGALLLDEGVLGEIYQVVRGIENFDVGAMRRFETNFMIERSDLAQVVTRSMLEVQKFEHPIED
jgi:c-di-GMP phosphodiesterase